MEAHCSAPQPLSPSAPRPLSPSAPQPPSPSAPQLRKLSAALLAVATGVAVFGFLLSAQPRSPSALESLDAGDFAKWYRQQSAATWFGTSTMKSKMIRGRALKVKQWLSKEDLKGIPSVLKARAAERLKARQIQLALDQGLSGQGAERLSSRAVAGLRGRKQQLYQILEGGEKYVPHYAEGDFADLPHDRVEGILNKLNNKFLNHTEEEYSEHRESMKPMTPEEVAKARAEELKRRQEMEENERQMAAASPKLKKVYQQEVLEHNKQTAQLNDLSAFINKLYNTTGYKAAEIRQCGDHCAETHPEGLGA